MYWRSGKKIVCLIEYMTTGLRVDASYIFSCVTRTQSVPVRHCSLCSLCVLRTPRNTGKAALWSTIISVKLFNTKPAGIRGSHDRRQRVGVEKYSTSTVRPMSAQSGLGVRTGVVHREEGNPPFKKISLSGGFVPTRRSWGEYGRF